jgi:prophage antirepressor-like protein
LPEKIKKPFSNVRALIFPKKIKKTIHGMDSDCNTKAVSLSCFHAVSYKAVRKKGKVREMNEMKIFNSPEFGNVRTIEIDGMIYFAGTDVAKALGYAKPQDAISRHCRHSVKRGASVIVSNRYAQSGTKKVEMIFIPESDLYRLIMRSQLESAEKFEEWVTADVLPSIRKTGKYEVAPKQDSYQIADPIERAKRWIEERQEKQLLEQKVKEQQPKADYFDNLVDSKLLTTFRDTAKEFHLPPKTFTDWLVGNKYVYRDKNKILKPYENHRKAGLFQMKDFTTCYSYSNVQTYITVKGKETFRLLLQGEGMISA